MLRTILLCCAITGIVKGAAVRVPPATTARVCDDSLTATLPDAAFSASTDYTNKDPVHNYAPSRGKLSVKVDPNPQAYKVGAWVALDLDAKQWLQVDLPTPSIVRTVTTAGRDPDPGTGCCKQWVSKYTVQYSLDGAAWTTVTDSAGAEKIFDGNTDSTTPVTTSLGCPVIAQYVRVRPVEWNNHIAMRMDLNGCKIASGAATAEPSTAAPTTPTTVVAGQLSNGQCVSDCTSKGDGFYQSCQGCNVYVRCVNKQITDNNPCPPGTVWNDNIKFCDSSSTTCPGSTSPTTPGTTTTTMVAGQLSTGQCVSDCSSKSDGFYQSCQGCDVYVRCVNKQITDNNPCPPGTVWNDNIKFCDSSSPTCQGPTSPTTPGTTTTTMAPGQLSSGKCVSDCSSKSDGFYQSCQGCDVYVRCVNKQITDNNPCPPGTVWNDNIKFCDSSSPTCQGPTSPTTPGTTTTTMAPGQLSSGKCVSDCSSKSDGFYQSCQGCDVYVRCVNKQITDNNPCPPGTVWNDNIKFCDSNSPTCQDTTPTSTVAPTTTPVQTTPSSTVKVTIPSTTQPTTTPKPEPTTTPTITQPTTTPKPEPTTTPTRPTTTPTPKPTTVPTSRPTTAPTPTPTKPGVLMPNPYRCVKDCDGVPNGDYQSCRGCNIYVTCSSGMTYDGIKCPASTLWNDNTKYCDYTSPTCP